MDRLDRLRERVDRYEKRLHEKPRRGRNRVMLTGKWITASEDFDNLFDAEAMRRFGCLF